LLRNLRLICTAFRAQIIEARIITGTFAGNHVFIPRIPLSPSGLDMPFTIRRLQFPVQPAFAKTVNKSQGQTMDTVGIYLRDPVFNLGQLYVALSSDKQEQCSCIDPQGARRSRAFWLYIKRSIF